MKKYRMAKVAGGAVRHRRADSVRQRGASRSIVVRGHSRASACPLKVG
ncbi:MAG: hypothetical protein ABL891_07285 [Burkholderiales bacterium]